MKKAKLLAAIAALIGLMAGAVVFGSPYEAVIGPCREIEELWAIEDEREESETPLVTALANNGVPLAYDAQENTFYCTLGLGQEEAWPEMHLTAPQARGVTLCFADDYTYDGCGDAIREGYAYEVLAYTETKYAYLNIVFTGLPIVSVQTQQEITREDTPVQVAMSAYGEEALNCYARMHLRGASTLLSEKPGYKVEFTRKASGKKKISCQTPGFGVMDGFILLAMASDETRMRDRLSWDLYAQMASDNESFSARRTGYVELFIDNQYMGLYLLVEPIDMEDELAKSGESCILTDSVYRTAALNFSYDRAYVQHPYRDNAGYELYYAPVAGHEFDSLQAYLDLLAEEDDEQFCEKALACVDTDSLLRYVLLIQGGGMTDNVFNNMYIWAHRTSRGVIYRFAPWDMDMTWGLKKEDIGEEFENWLYYPLADRLLNLNPDGLRDRLAQMWRQMRETALNEEHIAQLIAQYYTELRDSGALMRDGMRWDSGIYEPDGDEIINFCSMRFPLLDEAIGRMAASPDEPVDFLEATEYDKKGGPIIRDFVQTSGQRGQSGGNRRA